MKVDFSDKAARIRQAYVTEFLSKAVDHAALSRLRGQELRDAKEFVEVVTDLYADSEMMGMDGVEAVHDFCAGAGIAADLSDLEGAVRH